MLQLYVIQNNDKIIYKLGTYSQIKEKYPDATWIDVVDRDEVEKYDFEIPPEIKETYC